MGNMHYSSKKEMQNVFLYLHPQNFNYSTIISGLVQNETRVEINQNTRLLQNLVLSQQVPF